jgi:two-component system nitrate/nitrite response regulator NarL
MSLKLLVVDDHPLFRAGISSALKASGQHFDIVQAADAQEGIELAGNGDDFDAVLLDVALPGMNGFVAIREFRLRCPLLPVIIISAFDNASNARRALSAGAVGFIPKSAPTPVMIEALHEVLAGGVYLPASLAQGVSSIETERPAFPQDTVSEPEAGSLTVRQIEVLTFLCRGKGNKEIAADFGLSEKTVKTHLSAIFKVLRVVNRTQAVLSRNWLERLPGAYRIMPPTPQMIPLRAEPTIPWIRQRPMLEGGGRTRLNARQRRNRPSTQAYTAASHQASRPAGTVSRNAKHRTRETTAIEAIAVGMLPY